MTLVRPGGPAGRAGHGAARPQGMPHGPGLGCGLGGHRSAVHQRRTKIIAALGPATDAPGVLDEMVAAGMDSGRIDCAHDEPDRWRGRAAALRVAAERAQRPLALLVDLAVAAELEADVVALSFVRSGQDVRRLRGALEALDRPARVVAKIEKVEAFEALDEIVNVSDGVMVARGDLGVEAGVARVPLMQKAVVRRAGEAGKLVITATQMLESMITQPEPTRAEATDVANAILDGTSAVMLSGETTVGRYPAEAVGSMAEIAVEAEYGAPLSLDVRSPAGGRAEAVMQSAVHLAQQVSAVALVISTVGGGAARAAAKYRPRLPVIALSGNERVRRQLALEWVAIPGWLPPLPESIEEHAA